MTTYHVEIEDLNELVKGLEQLQTDWPDIAEKAMKDAMVSTKYLQEAWRRIPKSNMARYASMAGATLAIKRRGDPNDPSQWEASLRGWEKQREKLLTDAAKGHMAALNRTPDEKDGTVNRIERGWKFYDERPWLCGLFYWTGFDYRGEPNPMKFPATGSQFGVLDYCGFPKDEAYYLKSWWTDEPVLHLLPHWNLQGHEGETVDIWAYSNCDEVQLYVNGKDMGRKPMPVNGHLSWTAIYQPGTLKAVGYKNGKKVMTTVVPTTGPTDRIALTADRDTIKADNRDVAVVRVELQDKKKRMVPTACDELLLTVDGPVRILGVGNGNPTWQAAERPTDANARTFRLKAFNGLAQVLLQSTGEAGQATLTVQSADGIRPATITVNTGCKKD